jgi:hypothetical protein
MGMVLASMDLWEVVDGSNLSSDPIVFNTIAKYYFR